MADRINEEFGLASSSLRNLAWSESRFNPAATSTTKDRGVIQISEIYHPEVSNDCAFDPECSLRWGAQRIKDGFGSEWVPGNCYMFVKLKVKNLPKMAEIKPNTSLAPRTIAIFDYSGTKHVAYVESIEKDSFIVSEANYKPFLIEKRKVSMFDKNIVGFYASNAQAAK